MADSASELDLESDASSVDGTKETLATNEQFLRRFESLQQENRVLKTEAETLKLKIKGLNETIEQLRRNSVNIQAKAEQEEEYISNTLLKKITELKKEKESLAINYEQEEECLTNELNRKFTQLRQEKVALERTLAREQENQVSKLMRRIEKLEADMNNKQDCLDRLRREKIELENALEQEQEALVNRLWKKMEKLEAEKRILQEKLESVGAPIPGVPGSSSLIDGTSNISPRPTSSGPGSLRGSFRHHHISLCNTSGPSANLVSPGRLSVSSMSEHKGAQANQNSMSNEPVCSKIHSSETGDPATSVQLPPQSPMDVDALEHNASGAPSPCGSVGLASLPSTPNHLVSLRSPSTPCAAHKNHVSQEVFTSSHSDLIPNINSQVVSSSYVNRLREEVCRLRQLLQRCEAESASMIPQYESEEKSVAEENRRLRKLLQVEKERREALSRQLSESESSLEMEDERQFNEASRNSRLRTTSDSAPSFHPPGPTSWTIAPNSSSALYGPGHAFAVAVAASVNAHSGSTRFCRECGQSIPSSCSVDPLIAPANMSVGRVSGSHGTNYTAGLRTCRGRCCSPVTSANSSDVHNVNLSNSPATPTTASIGSEPFVKPSSITVSPQMNNYYFNSLPSNVVNDGHSNIHTEKRLSTYSLGSSKEADKTNDLDDGDEDDDARCATPPSYQNESRQHLDKCLI